MTASFVLTLTLALAAQGADEPPAFDADGLPMDAPAEPAPAPKAPADKKAPASDEEKKDSASGTTDGDASSTPDGTTDGDAASDKIEFVGDDENPNPGYEALGLPVEAEIIDTEPPSVDDFAVAAQNPNGAPYVTAVITDDASGVASAIVFTRQAGKLEWQQTPLVANDGGLFLGKLPDGLQKTGFEYYVEVTDAKGNGPTKVGSRNQPLIVEPAGMGELAREKIPVEQAQFVVHPAWVMVAMGAGILAAGVSGIFWYDLGGLVIQRQDNQALLDMGGLSNADRAELEAANANIDNAIIGDIAIAGTLTAIAAAALGTGIGMLVFTELE